MARGMTAEEIFAKQASRISQATPDIVRGVNAVTTSPTALAAKQADKARDNYVKAINSGEWAESLNAVSLDDWKRLTAEKADRVAPGVMAAKDLIVAFHEQRNTYQKTIDTALAGMGTRNAGEMDQRMLKQVNMMRQFKFRRNRR